MAQTAAKVALAALSMSLYLLMMISSGARGQAPMEREPVEQLKSHLPKERDDMSEKVHKFLQTPPSKLKQKASRMETNLQKVLKDRSHVSAFLVKDQSVLAQRQATGIEFNTTFLLPHAILLPILSTTLPILLEGFRPDLLTKPIGSVLKERHRKNDAVKDYLSLSLNDLVTKLPQSDSSGVLGSPSLFSELDKRGKAAFFYVKTVLEKVAEDAWKDALISVAMDSSVFADSQQMLTHLKDLSRYAEALGGDIQNFYEVAKSDLIPVDGGHFLYGWWINCPRRRDKTKPKCLAPFLPSNAMAIFHPLIRVYTIAGQGLHLLVANSDNSVPQTISQVLTEDQLIWKALYSVVDPPSTSSSKPKEEKKGKDRGGERGSKEEDGRERVPPTEPTTQVKDDQTVPPQTEKSTKEAPTEHPKTEQDKKPKEASPPPPVPEDEVVGESAPRKKTPITPGKKQPPPSVKEEDEVVEEKPKDPARKEEAKKEEKKREDGEKNRDERGARKEEKSLVVWLIYTIWPIAVFLFYTIFSHVWVYWIVHMFWLVCNSLFTGVHLPRPKTAKED